MRKHEYYPPYFLCFLFVPSFDRSGTLFRSLGAGDDSCEEGGGGVGVALDLRNAEDDFDRAIAGFMGGMAVKREEEDGFSLEEEGAGVEEGTGEDDEGTGDEIDRVIPGG